MSSEYRDKIRNRIESELSISESALQRIDLDAFAYDTAKTVELFQHVLNSNKPESDSFKTFISEMSGEQLSNIGYIALPNGEVVRLPSPMPSVKKRELNCALNKADSPSATNRDKVDFYQKELSKKWTAGRNKLRFSMLQRECFKQLADTFENHFHRQPKAADDSPFTHYLNMCVGVVEGDLKNLRELASMYLSNLEQTG